MQDFIKEMVNSGLAPKDRASITITGSNIKTYLMEEDKKGKPTGWYRYKEDEHGAVGQFGSHRYGESHVWNSKIKRDLDPETAGKIKADRERNKKLLEIERVEAQRDAADSAAEMLNSLPPATGDEPYFKSKGVKPFSGIKADGDTVVIPMWRGGSKSGVQTIDGNGNKRFTKGAAIDGGFFPLVSKEDKKNFFVICEGYATAATIREATGYPTVCAFVANNLMSVAEGIRNKYPNAQIIIAADNDQWRLNPKERAKNNLTPPDSGAASEWDLWAENGWMENIGIIKGKSAAAMVNGFLCYPDIPSDHPDKITDFNDIGLEATKAEIDAVVKQTKQVLEERKAAPAVCKMGWKDRIFWSDRDKGIMDNKRPLHNAIIIMSGSEKYGEGFAYNEFDSKVYVIKPLPWDGNNKFEPRELGESDLIRCQASLEVMGVKMGKLQTKDALTIAAEEIDFHPIRDYLTGLVWDKKPRLDTWLIDYASATEQPRDYVEAVSRCWLMAAVKRIISPGAAFHHMLVLEGGQGLKKSSLLKEMATIHSREYFQDRLNFKTMNTREGIEALQGCMIVEFQELDGLSTSAVEAVKSWITLTEDEVQRKFENLMTKFPRQFVLAGTTNEDEWLNDPTGGRRFWAIKVGGMVDIDGLAKVKEQLWAEAYHRIKAEERYWIEPDDPIYSTFVKEQSERNVSDPWFNKVFEYVKSSENVSVDSILEKCLHIHTSDWNNQTRTRINNILKILGFKNKVHWNKRLGRSIRGWVKDDKSI